MYKNIYKINYLILVNGITTFSSTFGASSKVNFEEDGLGVVGDSLHLSH